MFGSQKHAPRFIKGDGWFMTKSLMSHLFVTLVGMILGLSLLTIRGSAEFKQAALGGLATVTFVLVLYKTVKFAYRSYVKAVERQQKPILGSVVFVAVVAVLCAFAYTWASTPSGGEAEYSQGAALAVVSGLVWVVIWLKFTLSEVGPKVQSR